jgi:hypothetical protein
MSQYTDARRKMAGSDSFPNRQCKVCGAETDYVALSEYGARCFPCYQSYRREPHVKPERSPAAEKIRAEIEAMGRQVPA